MPQGWKWIQSIAEFTYIHTVCQELHLWNILKWVFFISVIGASNCSSEGSVLLFNSDTLIFIFKKLEWVKAQVFLFWHSMESAFPPYVTLNCTCRKEPSGLPEWYGSSSACLFPGVLLKDVMTAVLRLALSNLGEDQAVESEEPGSKPDTQMEP